MCHKLFIFSHEFVYLLGNLICQNFCQRLLNLDFKHNIIFLLNNIWTFME